MSGNKLNILVTGCGGDIGQSIGKILANYDAVQKIIGCDIHDHHPGKFIFYKCYLVPRCNNDNYFKSLEEIVSKENIDLIIPVSEPELRLYANLGITQLLFSKPVIIPNQFAMNIGFDKLETSELLKKNGFPAAKTSIISHIDNPELPVILKSRFNAGSKSIFYINDFDDFTYYKNKFPDYIAQEIIGSIEEEYTCGLFRSIQCKTRSIIFKRILNEGYSGFGEVVENDNISNLIYRIAELLNLNGSINVQLRLWNGLPYIFEINPRFSSTVLFRHLLGFKDVIWSIENRIFENISDYSPPAVGTKFYKGFNEYIEGINETVI